MRMGGGSRRPAGRRGAVILEFALILPVFLFLTVGLMEFARAYEIWQVVVNSAREGARIVALPPGSQSSEEIVRNRIDDYLLANHLDLANRTVDVIGIDDAPGTLGEVTVQYNYQFIYFGPIADWVGSGSDPGTIPLRSTSRMRNE